MWFRTRYLFRLVPFLFRFSHFSQLHDVQMLAMLACVFQQHYNQSIKNMQPHPQPQPDQKQLQRQPHPSSSSSSPTLPLNMPGPTSTGLHQVPGFMNSYKLTASPPKKVQSQQQVPTHSPISSSWQNIDNGEPQILEVEEQNYHEQECTWVKKIGKLVYRGCIYVCSNSRSNLIESVSIFTINCGSSGNFCYLGNPCNKLVCDREISAFAALSNLWPSLFQGCWIL